MKILCFMDLIEGIHVETDTTLLLLVECQRRGHEVWVATENDLTHEKGVLRVTARTGTVRASKPHWKPGKIRKFSVKKMDAVLIRKDPPFDAGYLHLTQMLLPLREDVFILNDPGGLQKANEKLYALQFREWMPETIVTSRLKDVEGFLKKHSAGVLKPLDGFGGAGVVLVKKGDMNTRSLFEMLSDGGTRHVMLQEYLSEVRKGDRRLMLLGGEPLGVVRRIPSSGDLRANVHAGGGTAYSDITRKDRALAAALKPRLLSDGIHLAGIDLIGGRLTEINVTSPTCIREMHRHGWKNLDTRIIRYVEEEAGKFHD